MCEFNEQQKLKQNNNNFRQNSTMNCQKFGEVNHIQFKKYIYKIKQFLSHASEYKQTGSRFI